MHPVMIPTVGLWGQRRRGPIVVHEFPVNTTTGSQDVIVPGVLWTPSAAIVMVSSLTSMPDGITGFSIGSFGFCTAAAQRCTSWSTRNDQVTNNRRSASSTYVAKLIEAGNDPYLLISRTSFIPGGIRINVAENEYGLPFRISIILFRSDMITNAAVGHFTGTGNINLGFQPSAIFTTASYDIPFDDSFNDTSSVGYRGLVSYDGTTTLQRGLYFGTYDGSPRQSDGFVGGTGGQAHTFTGTGTGFSIVSTDANVRTAYLAIAGIDAWVGHDVTPVATGVAPFPSSGGPSWAPEAAILFPSSATAYATNQTAGYSHGMAAADSLMECSSSWAPQDNSGVPLDYAAGWSDLYGLLNVSGGTRMMAGQFSGFDTGKVNINYSSVNASARYMAGMLLKAA